MTDPPPNTRFLTSLLAHVRRNAVQVASDSDPLPAPTTLATHTRGPRLLRRPASVASTASHNSGRSRSSRESSSAGSRHPSLGDVNVDIHTDLMGDALEIPSTPPPPYSIMDGAIELEPVDTDAHARARRIVGDGERPAVELDRLANSETPITRLDQTQTGGSSLALGSRPEYVQQENAQVARPSNMTSVQARTRRRAYSIHDEPAIIHHPGPSSQPIASTSTSTSTSRARKRRKVDNGTMIEAGEGVDSTSTSQYKDENVEIIHLPGELADSNSTDTMESKSTSSLPEVVDIESKPNTATEASNISISNSQPLSEYACPICFSPPTNATLTPCGHVCCGECLFTAVRASLQRAPTMGPPESPRCPVCRATLIGWDGKGGGVIGLKSRTLISL